MSYFPLQTWTTFVNLFSELILNFRAFCLKNVLCCKNTMRHSKQVLKDCKLEATTFHLVIFNASANCLLLVGDASEIDTVEYATFNVLPI